MLRTPRGTSASTPFTKHVERALWGGYHADRLGFAFAAGYRAALHRLFEHAKVDVPDLAFSLAATESGGAHPRAIQTKLEGNVLRGEKTFATLAWRADELLVVASRGETPEGRNQLVVVRVPRDAKGLVIEDRPPTPFAPEIPHAVVKLKDVAVAADAVLPGDGWDVWLKPFRTIEDTHVLAATIGYLLGVARTYDWERVVQAELVTHALSVADIAARDPADALTHVALAGLFAGARRLAASVDSEWHKVAPDERERWQRDMALLLVAENARAKRTENAFATF